MEMGQAHLHRLLDQGKITFLVTIQNIIILNGLAQEQLQKDSYKVYFNFNDSTRLTGNYIIYDPNLSIIDSSGFDNTNNFRFENIAFLFKDTSNLWTLKDVNLFRTYNWPNGKRYRVSEIKYYTYSNHKIIGMEGYKDSYRNILIGDYIIYYESKIVYKCYYNNKGSNIGLVENYYLNGSPKLIYYVGGCAGFSGGVLDGLLLELYKNGKPKRIVFYSCGKILYSRHINRLGFKKWKK